VPSALLVLGFASALGAGLLLTSSLRNRSFGEVLKGITSDASATGAQAVTAVEGTPAPAASTSLPAAAKRELETLAHEKGWSVSAWLAVIQKESGGNPAAVNKETGAYGIGQINPENANDPHDPRPGSTASKYPKYDSPDAVQQIEAMAEYIENDYGNPTKALESENTRGYY